MPEATKILIALVLGLGCVAIFLYELARKMETQVTIGKLAALGIAVLEIVVLVASCPPDALPSLPIVTLAVLIPVGLIWFGDELGSLTGIRAGLVNKTSPGFLVRMFGWLFLLAPIGLVFYFALMEGSR